MRNITGHSKTLNSDPALEKKLSGSYLIFNLKIGLLLFPIYIKVNFRLICLTLIFRPDPTIF